MIKEVQESLEKCSKLFVYGTLQQGYGNNRLLTGVKFLGPVTSANPEFKMYASGIPYLIGTGKSFVQGELYDLETSAITLFRCDQLEGHPNWYRRELRNFVYEDNTVQAWVYLIEDTHSTSRGYLEEPNDDNIIQWKGR